MKTRPINQRNIHQQPAGFDHPSYLACRLSRKQQVNEVGFPGQTDRYSLQFFFFLLVLFAGLISILPLSGQCQAATEEFDACLVKALSMADDDVTVGDLRQQCQKTLQGAKQLTEDSGKIGALEVRVQQDSVNVLQPFTLMAHKPNYILVGAFNRSGYSSTLFADQQGAADSNLDDVEAQFQLSFKFPLMVNLFGKSADIYAAYTNRSFWQVYNSALSSPFRETNHEPEAWLQVRSNLEVLGFKNTLNTIGINHQSNGRGGDLSRSWNRLFALITLEQGNLGLGIKPWVRISENEENDDNPDITKYLGHYEIMAAYRWKEHVISLMSRNNIESGFSRGAIEMSWSFPLWKYPFVRGYIQFFNGYGESLIDYDNHVNRLGIGFSLTDWL